MNEETKTTERQNHWQQKKHVKLSTAGLKVKEGESLIALDSQQRGP